MDQLDRAEKELLRSYDLGEWKPVVDLEAEIERYREYARVTLGQDRSVIGHKRGISDSRSEDLHD